MHIIFGKNPILVRQNSGPFVAGYIHAEKNQDIEVENDETHWVGSGTQDLLRNPSLLSQGFA